MGVNSRALLWKRNISTGDLLGVLDSAWSLRAVPCCPHHHSRGVSEYITNTIARSESLTNGRGLSTIQHSSTNPITISRAW